MTAGHPQETLAAAPRRSSSVFTAESLPFWLVIGGGAITVVLGIALLVWPGATLLVAVAFLAAQLIVSGVMHLVRCLGPWPITAGERTLLAIMGALSLLTALLIIRSPLRTLVVVTMLVGATWVLRGVMDIVASFPSGASHRGWSFALGALSLVAGGYVLLDPEISLVTFVWFGGVWMIASGITIVAGAVVLRRSETADAL